VGYPSDQDFEEARRRREPPSIPPSTTNEIKCLDHGYVKLIESWGSDERIVEAARMSTNKGFLGWGPQCAKCNGNEWVAVRRHEYIYIRDAESYAISREKYPDVMPACVTCKSTETKSGDEKLLKYLWDNKHATPFEMAGFVIEVQAPIETFRQWHRHRTQSYNEMSARYTPLPDMNYIPSVERLMMINQANKQAGTIKGAEELTVERAQQFRQELKLIYDHAEALYQQALSFGVSKELARIHLPVGRYSRMRASANLRNWLAFLTLRMDEHAQWEIRQFANAVGVFVQQTFPHTWELFSKVSF
jgi:thymidylate synthase (FAD)